MFAVLYRLYNHVRRFKTTLTITPTRGDTAMPDENVHSDGDIKHTASIKNWDVFAYNEWSASMSRTRRVHHSALFVSWDTWEYEGDPIPFLLEFQDFDGNPIIITPEIQHKSGYHREYVWVAFTGSPPAGETVSRIASARMSYEFQGKVYQLVAGRNWITRGTVIAIVAIVLLVIAVMAIVLAA